MVIVIDMVVFIKGKNIIVFSGVDYELNFCGFYDIVNLGFLFNFNEE